MTENTKVCTRLVTICFACRRRSVAVNTYTGQSTETDPSVFKDTRPRGLASPTAYAYRNVLWITICHKCLDAGTRAEQPEFDSANHCAIDKLIEETKLHLCGAAYVLTRFPGYKVFY
jgi:hypothetical protein